MILTFKYQFKEPIKAGTKIHTIREDKKGRWHAGRKIEFWCGNPRNTKFWPYQFGAGFCTKVKQIKINFETETIDITGSKFMDIETISDFEKLNQFAVSDGFRNWDFMKEWFYEQYPKIRVFEGKIIYFKADTSYSVADDQNSVYVYGQKYIAVAGNCMDCDLNKKLMCNKVPCSYLDREDRQLNLIFKKEKTDGTRKPH